MGKKITVILPLYLASLILLAFSVFPHHHHNSFICFNTIHHFSAEDPQHHPHPEIPEKGCHIQYLFQADNIKTFSRSLLEGNTTFHFTFSFIPAEPLSIPLPIAALGLFQRNDNEPLPQLLFSSHKFTRGPPQLGSMLFAAFVLMACMGVVMFVFATPYPQCKNKNR